MAASSGTMTCPIGRLSAAVLVHFLVTCSASIAPAAFLATDRPSSSRRVRSRDFPGLFGASVDEPKPEPEHEDCSICIIGGGVSGLTAGLTSGSSLIQRDNIGGAGETKIIILESGDSLGGRVRSDKTEDGFILDRGFAVFIEQYPKSKSLIDYEQLSLKRFLPGALVKTKGQEQLSRVADPLREPANILVSATSPIGTVLDKLRLIPLLADVFTKSIDEIFEDTETDTMTCLKERYSFSDSFIAEFLEPFLEGIYLSPLSEQSSRMFHFVFKMFSEGFVALPKHGMGAVAAQLATKAENAGVDIRLKQKVSSISIDENGGFDVNVADGKLKIRAKSVVLATDGCAAQKLLSNVNGLESLKELPEQPQRSVGCLYYGFTTEVPIKDPILVLNGVGADRGTKTSPINNLCFPSVVNRNYAPVGSHLCSVSILKNVLDEFRGKQEELDDAVRTQLATWFPHQARDIKNNWEMKGFYEIRNAQPAQFDGPFPAKIAGGRDCSSFRGQSLPEGLFVCGDHMCTATLNGALESGINAGEAAAEMIKTLK